MVQSFSGPSLVLLWIVGSSSAFWLGFTKTLLPELFHSHLPAHPCSVPTTPSSVHNNLRVQWVGSMLQDSSIRVSGALSPLHHPFTSNQTTFYPQTSTTTSLHPSTWHSTSPKTSSPAPRLVSPTPMIVTSFHCECLQQKCICFRALHPSSPFFRTQPLPHTTPPL